MAQIPIGSGSASAPAGDFVLILSCPDQPGIVHAVSGFLVEQGGNIVESQQFGDKLTRRFFMRIDFEIDRGLRPPTTCARRSRPSPIASTWSSSCGGPRRRTRR